MLMIMIWRQVVLTDGSDNGSEKTSYKNLLDLVQAPGIANLRITIILIGPHVSPNTAIKVMWPIFYAGVLM